jgi:hypothetical protein
MKSFAQYVLEEMPKYYPGEIIYQSDAKFTPISVRNLQDYNVIGESDGFIYVVHPDQTMGFVFLLEDTQKNNKEIVPVLRVALRDTDIKNYKQAFQLRIRKSFSKANITSSWYNYYVNAFGGIVSDAEHLEGGKTLWKSFIKNATNNPSYVVSIIDTNSGEVVIPHVTINTPESDIWSIDNARKNIVLVYEKP